MLARLLGSLMLLWCGASLVACTAELDPRAASGSSAGTAMTSPPAAGGGSGAAGAGLVQAGGSTGSAGGGGASAGSTQSGSLAGAAGNDGGEAGMAGASPDCTAGDCAPPALLVLDIDYQVQQTGYWCGPAATRVALSAWAAPPSQQALAQELGTTTNGTDWIGQVTQVLNDHLGAGTYVTTEMPSDPPTTAQRDRLWNDIVRSIQAGYPIVANIVAPPTNHPPGYPSSTIYHYFAITGYDATLRQVHIADSANFGGNQQYWLSFDQLATLIPPKGYSALH